MTPLRPFVATALSCLLLASGAGAATARVDATLEVVGQTPRYIGYNYGHFMPGSNTAAWVERSGVNLFRIWASPSYYEPTDDLAPYGDGVTDLLTFNSRKAALRANPESSTYIHWAAFNDRFANFEQTGVNHAKLNYMLGELRRLNLTVLAVISRKGWSGAGTWADKWEHWQHYYAVAYHLAKNYDVALYETYNEPDCSDCTMSQSEYIDWLRFASDAIRSAVADVNTRYGKSLATRVMAPTVTHSADSRGPYHMDADPDADPRDDYTGWGQKALQNLRKDYSGATVGYDIFDIYATHKYGMEGGAYFDEMAMLDTKMKAYTPTGVALPVFYTEFNRYSTSGFENPSLAGVSLSTPYVFCDLGLIFAKTMLKGVYGMDAFKFSNTVSDTYGPQRTGFHYVSDSAPYDIGGARKGAEVVRLFAKGFKDQRSRYKTTVTSSNNDYNAYTAFDPVTNNYYILSINSSAAHDYTTTFNVNGLGVYTGQAVSVEEVSAMHSGEVTQLPSMPSTKEFTLTQPRQSVWLLTIPKGPVLTVNKITPVADAQVQGGASANLNFGADTVLRVKRGATQDVNRAGYLKFSLSSVPAGTQVKRAILRVYGYNPMDSSEFTFHVYGLDNDSWTEGGLTWNTAPNLHPTSSKLTGVGTSAFPLGTLSVDATAQIQRVEVTDFVNKQLARDGVVTFALARELRHSSDTGDDDRHAYLNSREASANLPYLELWW
ncbi:DUF7594 domain-containing protein [Hyalangium sp.]|uniref:CBM96 family carbohydrate-binding protein n=1 Tax=Hyalangium sp. TaxID=2028555 RepID=UPI002D3C9426|nr:DNRLRE domain-containing protein [Hyalangium sp.]HYH94907.1 DNRLRE domain-containing protein [Hyalangium sp.]